MDEGKTVHLVGMGRRRPMCRGVERVAARCDAYVGRVTCLKCLRFAMGEDAKLRLAELEGGSTDAD